MMGATMKIRTELPTLLILTLVLGISPAHSQDRLPLVKVVATGGTIANTPSGRLHAGEVAEAIPQLKKVARLEVEEVMRVAAADEARGKGALVVTNDVINAARDVSKNISYRLETYSSRDIGALGFVDEDRVTFYRAPTRHPAPFDVTRLQKLPRVDVIY